MMSVMKRLLLLLILAVVVSPAWAEMGPGKSFPATVSRVVDGDTLKFEVTLFNVVVRGTCRMLGYNAPEIRGEERPLGLEAAEKLKELVGDGEVLVLAEENADRYGRWLCDIFLEDGTHVNAEMRQWLEEQGYAGVGKYDRLEN
jgi:micrococcal nuclease